MLGGIKSRSGGEAFFRQRRLALIVGQSEGDILPRYLDIDSAYLIVGLEILHLDLRGGDTGIALGNRQFKGNRIDGKKQIACCNQLILAHPHFDNFTANLGREGKNICLLYKSQNLRDRTQFRLPPLSCKNNTYKL